ncbi:11217_t:CDS:1, partial [Rhizophagus irregularis]
MTLFKSTTRVKPSNTEVNEKKDEKNYNSSIIPTDDDNCTITIIVPPTARPVNSRYSMQYLKQFQHEQQSQQLYTEDYSPGRLSSPKQTLVEVPKYSWKNILIITLISLILMITV